MEKLKTMKVLDVQWGTPKMPDDIKKYFFDHYDHITANDVWVEHEIWGEIGDPDILDKWLIDNCDIKQGDHILLKHWW